MTEPLESFFGHMRGYLLGDSTLAETREQLGPSPSGDQNFSFYRVLVQRNVFKILGEVHSPTRQLMERESPGLWATLVEEYIDAHPPTHWHPSQVGEHLSDFLAERRQGGDARLLAVYEEVADFCWTRQLAQRCPDDVGDGFDQRLFVRQYTSAVPPFVAALTQDKDTPIPPPQPTVVVIYRHVRELDVRVFSPSAAGLVALAKRQGAPIPEPLRAIPQDHVRVAEQQLAQFGIVEPTAPAVPA